MQREPGWRALPLDLQCEVLIRLWTVQPVGSLSRDEPVSWKGNVMVDPALLHKATPGGLCNLYYPTYEDWERFPPASNVDVWRDMEPKHMVFCPNEHLDPDVEEEVKRIRKIRRKRWQRTMRCFDYVCHQNLPKWPLRSFYLEPLFESKPIGVSFREQPFQQWHHECFLPAAKRQKYKDMLTLRIQQDMEDQAMRAAESAGVMIVR